MLISEKAGTSKFMDFVRDERQMAVLFEDFVRNFYRVHIDYRVKRGDIYWRWIAADQVAAGLLPKMQTDISLTSATRKSLSIANTRLKLRSSIMKLTSLDHRTCFKSTLIWTTFRKIRFRRLPKWFYFIRQ
jgi:5-methylcytosine-specific restriction endonuclease McrBC regulatory subunit McrC